MGEAIKIRRKNFTERPKKMDAEDEWSTTYNTMFAQGYVPPPKKKEFPYQSPYAQKTKASAHFNAVEEELQRKEILQEPTLICQPSFDGVRCICHLCGTELDQRPVYVKATPTVPRPPLPGDISKPQVITLKAKDWKGIPYPFSDARFEPIFPESRDTVFLPSSLNPFNFCQRRRVFPEYNRCPNLPVQHKGFFARESLGRSNIESKLFDRRWPIKRFPNPRDVPTHLW